MGDESRVAFSSADFGIEVLYDEREGYVTTLIDAFVGDRNPRASLSCLYVEAGLGHAQDVRETARTKHSLDVALGSQAAALRKLLPALLEPGAAIYF
jgi:hypothetical protein